MYFFWGGVFLFILVLLISWKIQISSLSKLKRVVIAILAYFVIISPRLFFNDIYYTREIALYVFFVLLIYHSIYFLGLYVPYLRNKTNDNVVKQTLKGFITYNIYAIVLLIFIIFLFIILL